MAENPNNPNNTEDIIGGYTEKTDDILSKISDATKSLSIMANPSAFAIAASVKLVTALARELIALNEDLEERYNASLDREAAQEEHEAETAEAYDRYEERTDAAKEISKDARNELKEKEAELRSDGTLDGQDIEQLREARKEMEHKQNIAAKETENAKKDLDRDLNQADAKLETRLEEADSRVEAADEKLAEKSKDIVKDTVFGSDNEIKDPVNAGPEKATGEDPSKASVELKDAPNTVVLKKNDQAQKGVPLAQKQAPAKAGQKISGPDGDEKKNPIKSLSKGAAKGAAMKTVNEMDRGTRGKQQQTMDQQEI